MIELKYETHLFFLTITVLFLTVSCTRIEQCFSFDGEHYKIAFTYIFDSQWLVENFNADTEELKAFLFEAVEKIPTEVEWKVIDDGEQLGFSFKISDATPGLPKEDWKKIAPRKEDGFLTIPFLYSEVILGMLTGSDEIPDPNLLLELEKMFASCSLLIYVDKTVIQKASTAQLLGSRKMKPASLDITDTGENFCITVPMNLLLNFYPYDRIVVRE